MNTTESAGIEVLTSRKEKPIFLPLGLPGFEPLKQCVLVSETDQAPFSWLQVANDPSLAFIVISPFEILPEYSPDIPKEDIDFLEISSPEDALLFCIVTLRGKGRATANLKGPIVLNRHTARGKQVVLTNAAQYQLQHPLPISES
ncbi:MAG: flagellar assembly protein FliW [Verrucomicrobiales bacterium]|nr:flagellar assembly protein FliW [Verrucomicrobiales bacterium]